MTEIAQDATDGRSFRVKMMFHPSHRVTDLDEVQRWFREVFNRDSTPLAALTGGGPQDPENRMDYSVFTTIQDVVFDSIDPKLYIKKGVQQYPSIDAPHLNGLGWYIEGVAEAFQELQRHDVVLVDQLDNRVVGEEPPTTLGSPLPMYWTAPESAGLRYQFLPVFPAPGDERHSPDWALPAVSDDDALGLERCSHHTILTDRLDRAMRLFVDVLGGTVIHEGRDDVRETTSTFVFLGDGVYELAVPDEGSLAQADWQLNAPNDTYHALTFKVADLDRAARHLTAQGVQVRTRTDDAIVTEPATSIGIPWGFVTSLTPGDPRAGS